MLYSIFYIREYILYIRYIEYYIHISRIYLFFLFIYIHVVCLQTDQTFVSFAGAGMT